MRVELVSTMRRSNADCEDMKVLRQENYVIDALTVFNRLFRVLRELMVPVAGHDLLFALMVAYNQVEGQLPESYNEFLTALSFHGQPVDTRHLGLRMQQAWHLPGKKDSPTSLELNELYHFLKNGAGLIPTSNSMFILRAVPDEPTTTMVEDIRYKLREDDAYATGYLYVKIKYYLDECGIEARTLFDPSRYPQGSPDETTESTPLANPPAAINEEAELVLTVVEHESLLYDSDIAQVPVNGPSVLPHREVGARPWTPPSPAPKIAPDKYAFKPAAPKVRKHFVFIGIMFGISAVSCLIGFKVLPKILR